MNNREQRPDDNGFIQPAGLSLPTQSYDSYQEHLEDEARLRQIGINIKDNQA